MTGNFDNFLKSLNWLPGDRLFAPYIWAIEGKKLLTLEEKIAIQIILLGCSKLIMREFTQGARARVRARSRMSRRDFARTNLTLKLAVGNHYNLKFRPVNLMKD